MKRDKSAQKSGEIIADRQAKSGSAIFAADRCIRLLKSFEDDVMLLRGNSDAGILHIKYDPAPLKRPLLLLKRADIQ
ncbi:hypothetical protein D3C72_2491790 [compost metagenome]